MATDHVARGADGDPLANWFAVLVVADGVAAVPVDVAAVAMPITVQVVALGDCAVLRVDATDEAVL